MYSVPLPSLARARAHAVHQRGAEGQRGIGLMCEQRTSLLVARYGHRIEIAARGGSEIAHGIRSIVPR